MKHLICLSFFAFSCLFFNARAQTITTVAGKSAIGGTGDGGPAVLASLDMPSAVCADPFGNFFIYDPHNNNIRKVNSSGTISAFAGTGAVGYTGDGGPATAATLGLYDMAGLASDPFGNIYIADALNGVIRKITTAGIISTVAGNGTAGYGGDGGPAISAQLYFVKQMTFDAAGNLYLVCGAKIRKVNTLGIITTVAGVGTSGYSGDGGPATAAELYGPSGVTVDLLGNMYIADVYYIRKVTPANIISTVGGMAGSWHGPTYPGDGGPATAANLGCSEIAIYGTNDLYFTCNYGVRKIDLATGIINTYAGTNAITAFAGDGGPATAALLSEANSLSITSAGDMYIADAANRRIRKVTCGGPFFVSGAKNVCIGSTVPLSGSSSGGSWASSNTSVASISTSGVVTGVSAGIVEITYTAVAGCGTAGTAIYAVTVAPTPYAGIIAGTDHVCEGDSVTLSDAVTGGTWNVTNSLASVSATGKIYGLSPGIDTVIYSVTNSCGYAEAVYSVTIDLLPDAGVISGSASVCVGDSVILSDAVSGGMWSTTNVSASVTGGGTVYGLLPGADTIIYIVVNSCGTASVTFPLNINACAPILVNNDVIKGIATTLFPNPTSGNLSISTGEGGRSTLITMDGKELAHYSITAGTTELLLPAGLVPGIYIVRFTGQSKQQQVFLIEYRN